MSKATRRRAGRKRDPDAKSRQTTRKGRGHGADEGTPELRAKRKLLSGSERVGSDVPIDVLLERRLITEEMRDEGLRFTMLYWWSFGMPNASCAALYQRMLAGGPGDEFTPRPEGVADDADAIERIRSQKARFARMLGRLEARGRLVVDALRRIAGHLEYPRFLMKLAEGDAPTGADHREMARLIEGLDALVQLRNEEDRHWRRRRQRYLAGASGAPRA